MRTPLFTSTLLAATQAFMMHAGASPISGLHVVGNAIVNGAGKKVVLHGVNHSGTEYACMQGWGIFDSPGSDSTSSVAAIQAWSGVNAVRIPLNEDCWLGINGVPPAYGGSNYRSAIRTYVNRLVAAGLVPILDLHWSAPSTQPATGQQPMPDSDHSPTFWKQVAKAYKGMSSVVFDAFNEPYPDSNSDTDEAWRCWRDGGSCRGVGYTVAGMQQIVNAIRGTGAKNVILLGGVEYSNALTQWLTHRPADRTGNVVAAWHVYNFNRCADEACWNQVPASVAAQVPLVAGEFGDDSGTGAMTAAFMPWMDARGGSYVAWSWNTWGGNLSLVTDDQVGTPTAWGTQFRSHVAGLR